MKNQKSSSAASILGGAAIGAATMYLLDPQRGSGRRAKIRDRSYHLLKKAIHGLNVGARDLSHRTQGVFAATVSALTDFTHAETVSNEILTDRVRAKLGRFVSHPHAIEVNASQGHVWLNGQVLAHERDRLISEVEKIRGVLSVKDKLEAHKRSENISSLQGGFPKTGAPIDIFQANWSPATRMLVAIASGPLAIAGFRRRSGIGITAGSLATATFLRAITNLEFKRLFGFGPRRAFHIHKSLQIHAPVDDVFDYFSGFDRFPHFLTEVKEVRLSQDGSKAHWVANGPAGIPMSWDTVTTRFNPNHELAWRSEPGAVIPNSGRILFLKERENLTRIDLSFSFVPPAGAIGLLASRLFGMHPKSKLDESLAQLKTLIEQGPSHRQIAGFH